MYLVAVQIISYEAASMVGQGKDAKDGLKESIRAVSIFSNYEVYQDYQMRASSWYPVLFLVA